MSTDSSSRFPEPAAQDVAAGPSRRGLLVGAGAFGVAGAVTLAPGSAAAAAGHGTAHASDPLAVPDGGTAAGGPALVAYVSDVAAGHITILRGDGEVAITDPALAAALARKAE